MNDTLILAIGAFLGAIVSGGVSIAVAKTNKSATTETATLPPYEALAQRVSILETEATRNREQSKREADENARQILMLKGHMVEIGEDRDQLVEYITEWFRWYHAGRMPPPPPVPMHLRDQLVWEEPSITVDPQPPPGD